MAGRVVYRKVASRFGNAAAKAYLYGDNFTEQQLNTSTISESGAFWSSLARFDSGEVGQYFGAKKIVDSRDSNALIKDAGLFGKYASNNSTARELKVGDKRVKITTVFGKVHTTVIQGNKPVFQAKDVGSVTNAKAFAAAYLTNPGKVGEYKP